jgi:glycosyltransferase involved in cell wall biosynthesis
MTRQAEPSVLHLSTTDISGGASRAAYRLHVGLRQLGVSSRMLVRQKSSDDPDVLLSGAVPEKTWHRAWRKAAPYLDDVPRRLLRTDNPTPISPAWLPTPTASDIRRIAPAVVNLHWVCGGFVSPTALPHIPAPLVWTLHDQWPFCGGEHYTGDDRRFETGYRATSRPPGESGPDVNRYLWQRKQRAYRRIPAMSIVAPSRWLADLARRSRLLGNRRIEHIPYGIDAARFHPVDRLTARSLLGFDAGKRIILFGAFGGVHNPRKDFALLANAIRHLVATGRGKNLALVIFGSGMAGVPSDLGIPVEALGTLHDDISLALVYAAADVYVSTSLADNLPLTVMEAMSCGTPVVGVDVGGMSDLVRNGETGALIARRDPAELAAALGMILEADGRRLGAGARSLIEREFTLERQAERYRILYREILAGRA